MPSVAKNITCGLGASFPIGLSRLHVHGLQGGIDFIFLEPFALERAAAQGIAHALAQQSVLNEAGDVAGNKIKLSRFDGIRRGPEKTVQLSCL